MAAIKFKYVHKCRTRHGKMCVYFRKGKGSRIRLPDDMASKQFLAAYHAAFQLKPIPHVRDMPLTVIASRKQSTERTLKSALRAARSRARKKFLPFALTIDWALAQAETQDFRCAVTGIEFFSKHSSEGKVNPYIPSLDRKNCHLGYTPENTRIVVFALNTMLLDWGEEVFEQVANSYRYTIANRRRLRANL